MSFDRFIIVSLSHIPTDARVRRQALALTRLAPEVVLIGIEGPGYPAPGPAQFAGLKFHTIPQPVWPLPRKLLDAAALLSARLPIGLERSLAIARRMPGALDIEAVLLDVLERSPSRSRTLLVANDWTTIAAALAAQQHYSVPFHFDVHELSYAEHAERAVWRLIFPPLIKAVEEAGLAAARSKSCVSPGIARLMAETYRLETPPQVILNVPDGVPMKPRRPRHPINVLFHGIFNPDRGLERLIRSTPLWSSNLRLVLRGHSPQPHYERALRQLVETLGVQDRVEMQPMVPQDMVIQTANEADIGIALPSVASSQNRFALPNKLFEYLHAGLMVVIPANTDMERVTAPYACCLAVPADQQTPEGIARAFSGIGLDELWAHKLRAYAAALELNWAREEGRFTEQFAD